MDLTWIILFRFTEYLCTTPTKSINKEKEIMDKTSEEEITKENPFRSKRPDLFYLNDKIEMLEAEYEKLYRQNLKLIDEITKRKRWTDRLTLKFVNKIKQRVETDSKIFLDSLREDECRIETDELVFFYTQINLLKDNLQELECILVPIIKRMKKSGINVI